MKIGIVQIDGKQPNLALMKICAYHEAQGDAIEWYQGPIFSGCYDKIYASQIFAFSQRPELPMDKTVIGGTGIDFTNRLPSEIEAMPPSYSLYPECDYHIGFSMKGCRFKCSFCCVPVKEGAPYKYSSIDQILYKPDGMYNNPMATDNRIVLLDNDFFGTGDWDINLRRIIDLGAKVNFNQGLNIRILTQRQADLLAKCKYYNTHFTDRYLTFAWDRYQDRADIMKGIERCDKAGISRKHLQFFVLIGYDTTPEQDLDRVMTLKDLGCRPFVMPYNKFDGYQKRFARWVNSPQLRNVSWDSYIHNYTR